MAFKFTLTGVSSMLANVQRVKKNTIKAVERLLFLEAQKILTVSKSQYVPVDLGVLRASGYVLDPVRTGNLVYVVIGFGGAASAYAIAIHETPSEHDPKTWKGIAVQFKGGRRRGRKYLEEPLRLAVNGMDKRIATVLEERMKGK